MIPIVTLISPSDTITLTGDDILAGWIYDNVTLTEWFALAETRVDISLRPNAPGAFTPGTVYMAEHRPVLVGQYFGTSILDARTQHARLAAMFNEGERVVLAVTDDLGMTFRQVWLTDFDSPWTPYDHFRFDISFVAPDPRRYGPQTESTDGVPTGSSGLVWNLGTAPSGLYWDWGTDGVLGQVTFTNTGGATSNPSIYVGEGYSIGNGVRITEIETGRSLTLNRSIQLGEVILFNSRTRRVRIGEGDVTTLLVGERGWFSVPKGATRRYQLSPLGPVAGSGSRAIRLSAGPAYL